MRVPRYRRHSNRDYAIVEHRGVRQRLPGRYNSPESLAAYARFLRALAQKNPPRPIACPAVADLLEAYLDHAAVYYAANDEYVCLRSLCGLVLEEYGAAVVADFGPLMASHLRTRMVTKGWSRGYINHQMARLRRIFRWGVEHELVPPAVLQGLQAIAPLREARTEARETEPVRPAGLEQVEATARMSTPVLAAMIRLQAITGMRSANLCELRPVDVDTSGEVWIYRPPGHKSAWRGRVLEIPLGPHAQEILSPFLQRPASTWCFSPHESEGQRGRTPCRCVGARYNTRSYRQAVGYACARAGIPPWHPHQLRHTVATAVAASHGLEAAQCYLGHRHADTTQLYTERDSRLAQSVARAIG